VRVNDLTPVERLGGDVWAKREDTWALGGHGTHTGAKVRTCLELARHALQVHNKPGDDHSQATHLVTAGSRHSPQVAIVAEVAASLGLGCQVHVPAGPDTPELLRAAELSAEVVRHRPGHNSVIVARAREAAKAQLGLLIPFGMECQAAVDLASLQVGNVPRQVERIVVPVGSGMSLAGILQGMSSWRRDPLPVLGVVVGADPSRRLDKWAPPWWRQLVELVPAGVPYHEHQEGAFLGGIPLDPVYEAKLLAHLQPWDLVWLVGRRAPA